MCFLSREREGMTINWEKGGLFLMNVHMQMDPSATPPPPCSFFIRAYLFGFLLPV